MPVLPHGAPEPLHRHTSTIVIRHGVVVYRQKMQVPLSTHERLRNRAEAARPGAGEVIGDEMDGGYCVLAKTGLTLGGKRPLVSSL